MAATAELFKRVPTDWEPIREAYTTRSPTPTFTELSGEFGISISGVSRVANEENWADIRARKIEQRLKESGATEILLEAIRDEGELTQRARRFVIDFIGTGELLRQKIIEEEGPKTSTQVTTLNNLGFAFANIGRFVESIASLSLSGKLASAKQSGANGDAGQPWNKGMLQQINVTVKNIQASAEAAKQAEPAIEAEPAP